MKPVQLSCNLRYWIKSEDWFCHKITYTGIHWMKILPLQPKPHLNHWLKSKLCVFKWNTDNMSFESMWEWQFLEGKANLYKTELEKKKSKTIKPIYTQTGFSWQPCFLAMRGVGELLCINRLSILPFFPMKVSVSPHPFIDFPVQFLRDSFT